MIERGIEEQRERETRRERIRSDTQPLAGPQGFRFPCQASHKVERRATAGGFTAPGCEGPIYKGSGAQAAFLSFYAALVLVRMGFLESRRASLAAERGGIKGQGRPHP